MKTLIKVFIVVLLLIFLIPMLFILAGEVGVASWFAGSDFGYILLTIVFIILAIIFLIKAFS
ncbi:MAG: hypothetical protein J6S84_02245 [Bacteroidales bacterium]|nr:hypothetical protein [Bacteroidales bacterium]MBO7134859.1 hypothetical protein [Bacteroidales bacterium]MBO7651520.1 hypothetical protein [Bacteroidales bacterium]